MKKIMAFICLFLALFTVLCVPVFASSAFDLPVNLPENTEYYYVVERPEKDYQMSEVEGCEYLVYCSCSKLQPTSSIPVGRDQMMEPEDKSMPVFVYYFKNINDVKNWLVSPSSITPLYFEFRGTAYVHVDDLVYTNHGEGFKLGKKDIDVTDKVYVPGSLVDVESTEPLFSEIIGLLPLLLPVLVAYIAIRKAISFLSGVIHSA